MEIPKKLKDEIWEYCRMNDIPNIDEFIIKMVQQGYTVEKFGATPVGTGEITEVEKIVEVIKEVPVEKIIEVVKEIPVEKIVEKEIYITDDEEVIKLTNELESVKKDGKVHLNGLREKVEQLKEKDVTIKTHNRKISDLSDKISQLESDILKLNEELEEEKKKNNKGNDIYGDEKKGGWFGSNLLNRR
jgi:uncharacterized coiled-coil DUF342 family protein